MVDTEYSQKIAEALDESDSFAFEMQILRMMTNFTHWNSDWQATIEHGGYYIDTVEGKRRQFDIRTIHTRATDTILMAIECKRIHESSPVVVSRVDRRDEESYHCILDQPLRIGGHAPKPQARRQQHNSLFYEARHPVGKSLANPKMNSGKVDLSNDNGIYDRYSQAISSVEAMLHDHIRILGMKLPPSTGSNSRIAAFPILVIPDHCLWVVDYDEKGERRRPPEKAQSVYVYLGREVRNLDCEGRFILSHFHIVTESVLLNFASSLVGKNQSPLDRVFGSSATWLINT